MQIIPNDINLRYDFKNDMKDDIFDGKYIREIISKKSHKEQLCFCIYTDELELVNPIGSNRTKHKLSKYNQRRSLNLQR